MPQEVRGGQGGEGDRSRVPKIQRVNREAYLVFPGNVQCSILNAQLNIQH